MIEKLRCSSYYDNTEECCFWNGYNYFYYIFNFSVSDISDDDDNDVGKCMLISNIKECNEIHDENECNSNTHNKFTNFEDKSRGCMWTMNDVCVIDNNCNNIGSKDLCKDDCYWNGYVKKDIKKDINKYIYNIYYYYYFYYFYYYCYTQS
jgi:hypothetical protein